jgi:hypothetical protein
MSLTEAEQAERAHIEWWCQEWDGHIGTHGYGVISWRPSAQSHVGRIVRREVWR